MTTSLKGKNLTNINGKNSDDLTKIKGIGPVKQKWLKELFNIHTCQDLAQLSVDEVESRLKTQGHTVSKSEIEGWIAQSQALATAELSSQPFVESSDRGEEQFSNLPTQESELFQHVMALADTEAEQPQSSSTTESELPQRILPSPNVEAGAIVSPLTNQDEWRKFASFRVEFQSRITEEQGEEQRTIIHYIEANKFQTWSEIGADQLQEWMLEQISEQMCQSLAAESPVAVPPITLEITQIRALQAHQTPRPMVVAKGNRVFPYPLSYETPFALEVGFNLTGLTALHLTNKQVEYYAQFHVRNRMTGEVIHLGDTESATLTKGQLSYTAVLADITMEPGVYRLQAIVKLQCVPVTLGSFKVPLLQVV
ncbi:hypothetical protein [Allocoleopsis sp.]|uniref:hypothetical protein n=1 Tax=Allocoleopsis sp. TaxID=3088169 RepID=UPI002FD298C7